LDFIFHDLKPIDGHPYIQFIGYQNNKRIYKWVRHDYILEHESLQKYKVIIPSVSGSGAFGETLSSPFIGRPQIATTQTFLTIGPFDYEDEAKAALKYISSKFARALLGVLKVTQHITSPKWKYVPLQDFTATSDIDWSQSIKEIDQQLYKKYGLNEDEVEFIESREKEME
jgi:hypothetical protein